MSLGSEVGGSAWVGWGSLLRYIPRKQERATISVFLLEVQACRHASQPGRAIPIDSRPPEEGLAVEKAMRRSSRLLALLASACSERALPPARAPKKRSSDFTSASSARGMMCLGGADREHGVAMGWPHNIPWRLELQGSPHCRVLNGINKAPPFTSQLSTWAYAPVGRPVGGKDAQGAAGIPGRPILLLQCLQPQVAHILKGFGDNVSHCWRGEGRGVAAPAHPASRHVETSV